MNTSITDITENNTNISTSNHHSESSSSIQSPHSHPPANDRAHTEASSPSHPRGAVPSSPESRPGQVEDTSATAGEFRESCETRESREIHRLGKIARLPRHIRQQLNERLADNEPSDDLLVWLNEQPLVQTMLQRLFEGRPITKQNLSTWRLGGFRDWEQAQEARSRARAFLEEAEEVTEELEGGMMWDGPGCPPFLDRVSDRIALGLLELFYEAEASEKGPRRTREMLEIARELARLRRGDHQQRRLAVQQERWVDEQELAHGELESEVDAEIEAMEQKARDVKATERVSLEVYAALFRKNYLEALAAGTMTPEKEKATRTFFTKMGPQLAELGIRGLPEGPELKRAVAEMRVELKRKEKKKAQTKAAEKARGTSKGHPTQSKRDKA